MLWLPLCFALAYLLWLLWGWRKVPGAATPTLWGTAAMWTASVGLMDRWTASRPFPDTGFMALLPLVPWLLLAVLSLALGSIGNRASAWACWGVTPALVGGYALLMALFATLFPIFPSFRLGH